MKKGRDSCAYRPLWLEAAVEKDNQEHQVAESTHQTVATRKIQV